MARDHFQFIILMTGFLSAGTLSGLEDAALLFAEPTVRADSSTLSPAIGTSGAPEVTAPQGLIVQLVEPSLAAYRGGIDGLEATNPKVLGQAKLDPQGPASRAYRAFISSRQDEVLRLITAALGRRPTVVHRYSAAFNGFAIAANAEEAEFVRQVPGVLRVQENFARSLASDASPNFIGATRVWEDIQTRGEGVVIGTIDSGIYPEHLSFAAVDADRYEHTNPLGSGNYLHVCDPQSAIYSEGFPCNDKLIGAWHPTGAGDARDAFGHGTAMASIAAGNVVRGLSLRAPTKTLSDLALSGIAPRANLISYQACITGGCPGSYLLAAIDQAVLDGVDVISYGVGGAVVASPWVDSDSLALLDAVGAGVLVAVGAGNSGPGPGTILSPADAPWLTAVAASSHDRIFPNTLVVKGGVTTPDPIVGRGITAGYGPAPIVHAASFGDGFCLSPFPAGTWSGEIVVCNRGSIARVAKGENVLAGGAGGLVLANQIAQGSQLNADPHVLPAVHITHDDGQALEAWLGSGSGHEGLISGLPGASFSSIHADIVQSRSSRGPAASMEDVLKPDVAAPGADILSASIERADHAGFLSGTSGSAAQVAGLYALMRAAHPRWSPAEIRSAVMTTALTNGLVRQDKKTPADAFDIGAGRVQARLAVDAGLVLDEQRANFLAADPSIGGDPTTLNLASMANSNCIGGCQWTRTVKNTLSGDASWTVEISSANPDLAFSVTPEIVRLNAGASQPITVTVNALPATEGTWHHAALLLVEERGLAPDARLPIAIKPVGSSDQARFTKTVSRTNAIEGDRLTYSLTFTNLDSAGAFSLSDPIPANAIFVPGSLSASSGTPWATAAEVTWNGALATDESVTISFQVDVGSGPNWVVNAATMAGGAEPVTAAATTRVAPCTPNLQISNRLIDGLESFFSCDELVVGPEVSVSGIAVFKANSIVFEAPFSVVSGGELAVKH